MFSGCAPRYGIHTLAAPGFEVDGDAYVAPDTAIVVAYDFWAPAGQPFVSLLNTRGDTAYLDLVRSSIRTEAFGQVSLLDALGGGPDSRRRDVRRDYPELPLTFDERSPELVLAPETWVSFFGIDCASEPGGFGAGGAREGDRFTVDYVWRRGGVEERSRHSFQVVASEPLRAREYRRYGASRARPNRFFVDRGPARRQQALNFAMDVSTSVLWEL